MTRVVVVDDNLLMRKQIAGFFRDEMKFEVVGEGKDGIDAVELYRQHKPDIITLDVTMPRKDGIEALEEIIREFPDARVVMVSAIIEEAEVTEALKIGAKSYIKKPLRFKEPDFVKEVRDDIAEALAD